MVLETGSRVLSIQSHVTYGYVGGKAAVFPLQCLGYDVDVRAFLFLQGCSDKTDSVPVQVVNTVDFSNHSGYGRFGGSRATAQDLATIFDTMEANGLLTQDRLLTGYIPSAEALSTIAKLAKRFKERNPEAIYLLDPVLGDSGKLYVAPDVIPIYRELLPQATIITPNWFEVETLTNTKLTDMLSLRRGLRILHEEYHVPHVVMSSIPLHEFLRNALPAHLVPKEEVLTLDGPSHLICISSSYNFFADGSDSENGSICSTELSSVHAHTLPCIPGYFSGVGDLFSALVLAHFQPRSSSDTSVVSAPIQDIPTSIINGESHSPLSDAVSLALSKTFAILKFTHEQVSALHPVAEDATDEERDRIDPERRVRRMRTRELRLIQGQNLLRTAPAPISSTKGIAGVELRKMHPWNDFWT